MKKWISMLMAVVLAMWFGAFAAAALSGGAVLGDVDRDTKVTVLDATRLQRWLAGICDFDGAAYTGAALTEDEVVICDADQDSLVTILDATSIQRHLAMLPTAEGIGRPIILPTEEPVTEPPLYPDPYCIDKFNQLAEFIRTHPDGTTAQGNQYIFDTNAADSGAASTCMIALTTDGMLTFISVRETSGVQNYIGFDADFNKGFGITPVFHGAVSGADCNCKTAVDARDYSGSMTLSFCDLDSGSPLSYELNNAVNSALREGFASWEALVTQRTGLGLDEIGFKVYPAG